MFYRGCGTCGERWAIGMASTCKCPNEKPKAAEWVEITKGECDELFRSASDHVEYAYAIEAKLKEKNGYPACPPCTHDCNEGRDCPARKHNV